MTVNDYLARRDAEWMKPIYDLLGVTVGILQSGSTTPRQAARPTPADVTYGTNSEFGFDYLRDNLAVELEEKVQRGHGFAIVDEVDNILIDEARTPLIISGQPEQAADLYYKFARARAKIDGAGQEARGARGQVEGLGGRLRLRARREAQDGRGRPSAASRRPRSSSASTTSTSPSTATSSTTCMQALKAESLYKRDVDYAVIDGEVKIIDEFTGRILEGRRWSEGLHQAVEAKEGVAIQEENQTRRHDHLPELLPPLRQARAA